MDWILIFGFNRSVFNHSVLMVIIQWVVGVMPVWIISEFVIIATGRPGIDRLD